MGRPSGSGGAPASAALPLLGNARSHCLRRGALHLPARRSERDPCYYSDRLPGSPRLRKCKRLRVRLLALSLGALRAH